MWDLDAVILKTAPREKAGARSGARFAFQAHVSLMKILDLHETDADYRAIFDHFDDLTILNASEHPVSVDFFQIKGQEASWTVAKLCTVKGIRPRTAIGKMYAHSEHFAGLLNTAVFITNAPFSFELATGRKSTPDHVLIGYGDLGIDDRLAFGAALEQDFPSPRNPHEAAFIRFERSMVPLKGYELFLQGRLVSFFAGQPGVAVDAVYRTLIADITARANDTTECAALRDLFDRKSLCRGDFTMLFSAASRRSSIFDSWTVVDGELRDSGRSSVARIRIRSEVLEYIRARSKRTAGTAALASAIRAAALASAQELAAVEGFLEAAGLIAGRIDPAIRSQHDSMRFEAALLAEAFEAVNG